MALARWLKVRKRVRCARCGLTLKRAKTGDHTRFKVDHAAWVRSCLAIKGTSGATAPFECPDLKAATRLRTETDQDASQ